MESISREQDIIFEDSPVDYEPPTRKRIGWNYQNVFKPATNGHQPNGSCDDPEQEISTSQNSSSDDIEVLEVKKAPEILELKPSRKFPPSSSKKEIKRIIRNANQSTINSFFEPKAKKTVNSTHRDPEPEILDIDTDSDTSPVGKPVPFVKVREGRPPINTVALPRKKCKDTGQPPIRKDFAVDKTEDKRQGPPKKVIRFGRKARDAGQPPVRKVSPVKKFEDIGQPPHKKVALSGNNSVNGQTVNSDIQAEAIDSKPDSSTRDNIEPKRHRLQNGQIDSPQITQIANQEHERLPIETDIKSSSIPTPASTHKTDIPPSTHEFTDEISQNVILSKVAEITYPIEEKSKQLEKAECNNFSSTLKTESNSMNKEKDSCPNTMDVESKPDIVNRIAVSKLKRSQPPDVKLEGVPSTSKCLGYISGDAEDGEIPSTSRGLGNIPKGESDDEFMETEGKSSSKRVEGKDDRSSDDEEREITTDYSRNLVEKFIEKWKTIQHFSSDQEKIRERIWKKYYLCHSTYTHSRKFVNGLKKAIEHLNAENQYTFISNVIDSLKRYKEVAYVEKKKKNEAPVPTKEVEKEEDLSPEELKKKRKLQRVEKEMMKLTKKINKLEEAEVDFDDEVNSSYLILERLKNQFVRLDEYYCKLAECSTFTGRPVEKKFKYEGSRYPEVNKRITAWVNKNRCFPEYMDILDCVKKVTKNADLPLRPEAIRVKAQEIFRDVGQILKERRERDDLFSIYAYAPELAPEDPALNDLGLERKLKDNSKHAKENLDQVFQFYVDKDDEKKKKEKEEEEGKGGKEKVNEGKEVKEPIKSVADLLAEETEGTECDEHGDDDTTDQGDDRNLDNATEQDDDDDEGDDHDDEGDDNDDDDSSDDGEDYSSRKVNAKDGEGAPSTEIATPSTSTKNDDGNESDADIKGILSAPLPYQSEEDEDEEEDAEEMTEEDVDLAMSPSRGRTEGSPKYFDTDEEKELPDFLKAPTEKKRAHPEEDHDRRKKRRKEDWDPDSEPELVELD